jgi:hypothetical protein
MLRTMLSLEPATVTNRRYPLLFQTGETAYGTPLVDAQQAERITRATGRSAFPLSAFTAGYTRDIPLMRSLQSGVGANATSYVIDSALKPFYGNRPWGVNVYLRFRLRPGA